MPQMNPMNWNLILLLNIINFALITPTIYFSKSKTTTNKKLSMIMSNKNYLFKW